MSIAFRHGLRLKMRDAGSRPRLITLLLFVLLTVFAQAGWSGTQILHAAQTAAILNLRKTASTAGPVVLGDVFTYQLCYQNTGGESAQGATLVDHLPKNLDYISGSSATGVYDPVQHRLTWNLGDMQPGPEACLSFGVRVARNDLPDVGGAGNRAELLLSNRAVLGAANAAGVEATHDLLFSSVVNPVVTKTASSASVFTTSPITFTLTIRNDGNAPATQVVLSDLLSAFLENVSASSSQGVVSFDAAAHKVTAQIGTLDAGRQVIVTIKARVKALHPNETPVTFNNSAIVTFIEGNQRDSNRVQVTISGPPPPPEIPEPATVLLVAGGLAGLAGWARRRRLKQGRG